MKYATGPAVMLILVELMDPVGSEVLLTAV